MKDNRLDSFVSISQRYQKSVWLESDIHSKDALQGFILQRSGAVALETIASHISSTNQRAFTITGPFGSGKSSLSLFLSLLIQGNEQAFSILHSFLEKNIGFEDVEPVFCKEPHYETRIFTGHKGKLEDEIVDWIRGSHEKSFRDNLHLLREQSIKRFPTGLIIIVDELGKYLEGGQSDNCYALQEFSEVLNRTSNVVFIGVLHQSFAGYVSDKSLSERNEWSKVQGRFVDVPLLSAPDEILQMTAEAVVCSGKNIPKGIDLSIAYIVDFLASKKKIDRVNFTKTLKSCWPLNPTVAMLLSTLSRRAFFQNTRSVFNFLVSREPFGFNDFLEKTKISNETYSLPNLWDYLVINYEQVIVSSIKDSRQFALASQCIANSQKYGLEAIKLIKSISVLDIFGYGTELLANKEVLLAALPDLSQERLKDLLSVLIDKKIIIEHKFNGSFSLFDGSDFDFEKALQEVEVHSDEVDAVLIKSLVELPPIIAKRHYSQTGALRWFSRKIVYHESQITGFTPEDGSCGTLFLCLEPSSSIQEKKSSQENFILKAFPSNSKEIISALNDLQKLKIIRKNPLLEGDRPARHEIENRINVLETRLTELLEVAFFQSRWVINDGKELQLTNAKSLNALLSDLCDKAFKDCPAVKNELINKNKLSANITRARRLLMEGMIFNWNQPRLGMTKYPPQVMLYISVLEACKLHVEENGRYKFVCDRRNNAPLKNLWDATYELMGSGQKVSLTEIYNLWSKAPIGLKAGLSPIFSLAFFLANMDKLYLYINGAFEPDLNETVIDEWLLNPEKVQFRFQQEPEKINSLLKDLAKILEPFNGKEIIPSALPVGREIVRIVLSVPSWTQKTIKLSAETKKFRKVVIEASDPIKLLCIDLEDVFGKVSTDELVQKVSNSLWELVHATPTMLSEVRSYLYKCIDSSNIEELHKRADAITSIAGKLQLQAFVGRIANLNEKDESIEGILTLAIAKPKKIWTDRDIQDALNRISEWCLSFRHLESFASLQSLTSNRRIVSLITGDQKNKVEAIVDYSIKPNAVVSHATEQVLSILSSLKDSEAQATLIESCLKLFDRKISNDN